MTDWRNLPTEAEMRPEDFGPKQIKLFLEKMAKDILPESEIAKFGVSVGEDEVIFAAARRYTIYKTLTGWEATSTSMKMVASSNPMHTIHAVITWELQRMLDEWEMINYACMA